MNARLFSDAMSEVCDKYYEEAANYRSKRWGPAKWGGIAACLAAVIFTAFSLLPDYLNRQSAAQPDYPGGAAADSYEGDADGVGTGHDASGIRTSMGDIRFNEIEAISDAAKIWYDPELYDTGVYWDRDEVMDYYGKDLTPPYIPDGLTAASGNGTARVVLDKSGGAMSDTAAFGFYHDYYEDGSPKLTEDVPAVKGFSITASKIGILSDCIYLLPENEVKTSCIGETAVVFGYRRMPYGPYDPDTHEPSGYYDMYVAEFEYDGIEYQIVAEQMEAEEVVKIVASVICGEEAAVDE